MVPRAGTHQLGQEVFKPILVDGAKLMPHKHPEGKNPASASPR